VHVVLPGDVDDPAAPSGGNVYDRRVCAGLAETGWTVREHDVGADQVLSSLPDGALVLIDGLAAVAVPAALAAHADRLRLVVLLHMVFGDTFDHLRGAEREVLRAAAAVVTTSEWTRRRVLSAYRLSDDAVHVAAPGVDPAPVSAGSAGPAGSASAAGTAGGGELLCVAAVAPHKGHDVLVAALGLLVDLDWRCVCVGSLTRDPAFVADLRARLSAGDLAERFVLAGPRTGADLAASYATADLLVHPSRGESYGMVVAEALAHGIPVLASDVGGVPEALGGGVPEARGVAPGAAVPGMLVPPGDPDALAEALRRWLTQPTLRARLRESARVRRTTQTDWATTARLVSCVLSGVALRAPRSAAETGERR
jgi:glycosyltransferase involved in cell wall biosynthesis